jgi:hypothetical protein
MTPRDTPAPAPPVAIVAAVRSSRGGSCTPRCAGWAAGRAGDAVSPGGEADRSAAGRLEAAAAGATADDAAAPTGTSVVTACVARVRSRAGDGPATASCAVGEATDRTEVRISSPEPAAAAASAGAASADVASGSDRASTAAGASAADGAAA